jgi:hypothetical protein
MRTITIEISDDLYDHFCATMGASAETDHNTSIDEIVALWLRATINNWERNKALKLSDKMPFGQYRGEMVERVIRAFPDYMRFLLGLPKPIKLAKEALDLLAKES